MLEWTDAQIRTLIDERRNRNIEYHNLGRNRNEFWNSIANRINQEYNTSFNGHHCKEKFSNLVRNYNAMCEYMAGSRRARRNRSGAQYFDEFRTHFWERSEDEFDRIRNINTSNRRQNRYNGNTTPAPSIEDVEREISVRSSVRRLNRGSSVVNRRSQRQSPYPSLTRDEININTNNSEVGNLEQNIQPPPYEATNEAQNINSSEINQSYNDSNLSNIPLSRNESDVIMPDAGASQELSNI